eukprot:SAG11_NODE_200_length_12606_cov_51.874550_7_plen_196_part_00
MRRMTKGSPFIEVEWTAGPIPMTPPAGPPPPPPMKPNLSGPWDVGCGTNHAGTFAAKADGSFTVTGPEPTPNGCWKSATGQITGHDISIRFSNGVQDHGHIDPDNAYIHWHNGEPHEIEPRCWNRCASKGAPAFNQVASGFALAPHPYITTAAERKLSSNSRARWPRRAPSTRTPTDARWSSASATRAALPTHHT